MKLSLHPWLAVVFPLLLLSCKSYRPTPGLRDSFGEHAEKKKNPKVVLERTPKVQDGGPAELPPDDTLLITKLNPPTEVARYNRTCVIVKNASKPDVVIKDYKLGTPIDIVPFENYSVIVELYLDSNFVYSSAFCETGESFQANLGRNIFTIPVCEKAKDEDLPSAGCT